MDEETFSRQGTKVSLTVISEMTQGGEDASPLYESFAYRLYVRYERSPGSRLEHFQRHLTDLIMERGYVIRLSREQVNCHFLRGRAVSLREGGEIAGSHRSVSETHTGRE